MKKINSREYATEIRMLAREYREKFNSDRERLEHLLNDHQYLTYSIHALRVLEHSPNWREIEQFGIYNQNFEILIRHAAAHAMRADIVERADRLDD